MENLLIIGAEQNQITYSKNDITKFFNMPEITDTEFKIFCDTCKSNNLNPAKREVYLNKYGDKLQIVTGYEVYIKRAEQSQKYGGMKAWTEGTIRDETLKGCVEVYRKDWEKPLFHEVFYTEYVQLTKEGNINKFWREKPITMIKKVAISQAFRWAFPDELEGMPYTKEEMPSEEHDKPEQKKAPEAPKRKSETGAEDTREIILEAETTEITKKAGSKNGKDYVIYYLNSPEGKFSTFSESFAKLASDVIQKNGSLKVTCKKTQYGFDIIHLEEVAA